MSTFNGERNLVRQVKSILAQRGVRVLLTIRDDGSQERTVSLLKEINRAYKNVEVVFGENIGYKKSFLSLFDYLNKDADYFAFSDQDDIWEDKKLFRAVEKLEKVKTPVRLYVSSIKYFDEQLNFILKKDVTKTKKGIRSLFTRNRYAGCTFVFSRELARIVANNVAENLSDKALPDHDFYVISFAYTYGDVLFDSASFIKHIRYKNSVTAGNGILKRLKVEYTNTFKRDNTRVHMAEVLLESQNNIIESPSPEVVSYLKEIVHYKDNIFNRVYFMRNLSSGILICNLETSFQVLIGKF